MRLIPSTTLVVALLLLAACDRGEAGSAPPASSAADSIAPAGEWITILERDLRGKQATPEPFRAASDSLRVITTLGELISPYSPGLVITNLLSDSTVLPVASIRAEQLRPDTTTSDTAIVEIPRGTLYFFVPEHRGLTAWSVAIQEFRPTSGG